MESFFHALKTERVRHRIHATYDEARRNLFAHVEGGYSRRRLHSGLGYRTPAEAEHKA
jgi:transposase InsO family protein